MSALFGPLLEAWILGLRSLSSLSQTAWKSLWRRGGGSGWGECLSGPGNGMGDFIGCCDRDGVPGGGMNWGSPFFLVSHS